jgi:preprotein translocase subunit SecA
MWNGVKKILGLDPNERALKKYWSVVEEVNAFASEMESLGDDELRRRGAELKAKASEEGGGEGNEERERLQALLPETFALVREASRRTIGLRH